MTDAPKPSRHLTTQPEDLRLADLEAAVAELGGIEPVLISGNAWRTLGWLSRARAELIRRNHVLVRARHGTRLHLAHAGSSVVRCGHWLEVAAGSRKVHVPAGQIEAFLEQHEASLCERCGSIETFLYLLTPAEADRE